MVTDNCFWGSAEVFIKASEWLSCQGISFLTPGVSPGPWPVPEPRGGCWVAVCTRTSGRLRLFLEPLPFAAFLVAQIRVVACQGAAVLAVKEDTAFKCLGGHVFALSL